MEVEKKKTVRTLRGPIHRASQRRLILVNLGPYFALAIPGGRGLAGGDLGDVERHRTGMGDGGLSVVGDPRAGGDIHDPRGAGSGVALVAPHLLRADARDWPIALEIRGCADILPVLGVADAGEGVWFFVIIRDIG